MQGPQARACVRLLYRGGLACWCLACATTLAIASWAWRCCKLGTRGAWTRSPATLTAASWPDMAATTDNPLTAAGSTQCQPLEPALERPTPLIHWTASPPATATPTAAHAPSGHTSMLHPACCQMYCPCTSPEPHLVMPALICMWMLSGMSSARLNVVELSTRSHHCCCALLFVVCAA